MQSEERVNSNSSYNSRLCIICQKRKRDEVLTSTENGRNKIKSAGNIRRDEVYYRLKCLSSEGESFQFCFIGNVQEYV